LKKLLTFVFLLLLTSCSTKWIGMEEFATRTTAELHLYADGTSGSDANDGLTVGTPKKTLAAVVALIPDHVTHNVLVHLIGEFVITSAVSIDSFQQARANAKIIFLGKYDTWTDVGGGTKTATGSSVSSLVVAGAGWVANAYAGYMVKVLTGAAAGQVRMVQLNTADTITPMKNFSVDPGVGATFDIVRPATTITAASSLSLQVFRNGCQIDFSSLSFTNKAWLYLLANRNYIYVRACVFDTTATNAILVGSSPGPFALNMNALDDSGAASTAVVAGVGLTNTGKLFANSSQIAGMQCVARSIIDIQNSMLASGGLSFGSAFLAGIRAENISLQGSIDSFMLLDSASGYAVTYVTNPSGVGLLLRGCPLVSLGDVSIGACSSHGVEVVGSFLKLSMSGATTGTGNAGAGVYAHSGSVVHIKDGTPPTITGAVGDFSTDGTTAATTWAAVDGGTPYTDATELTMVKEVP
jgi:hypothetical protein